MGENICNTKDLYLEYIHKKTVTTQEEELLLLWHLKMPKTFWHLKNFFFFI